MHQAIAVHYLINREFVVASRTRKYHVYEEPAIELLLLMIRVTIRSFSVADGFYSFLFQNTVPLSPLF